VSRGRVKETVERSHVHQFSSFYPRMVKNGPFLKG